MFGVKDAHGDEYHARYMDGLFLLNLGSVGNVLRVNHKSESGSWGYASEDSEHPPPFPKRGKRSKTFPVGLLLALYCFDLAEG